MHVGSRWTTALGAGVATTWARLVGDLRDGAAAPQGVAPVTPTLLRRCQSEAIENSKASTSPALTTRTRRGELRAGSRRATRHGAGVTQLQGWPLFAWGRTDCSPPFRHGSSMGSATWALARSMRQGRS